MKFNEGNRVRSLLARRCRNALGVCVVLASVFIVIVGCSSNGSPPFGGQSGGTAGTHGVKVHPNFIVKRPLGGAYLGAQVNPSGSHTATPEQLETETENLESAIGRKLALHLQYRDWAAMVKAGSDTGLKDDIANGRVPIISWNCGDDNGYNPKLNLVQIANGLADHDLQTIKAQLASLTYPNSTNPYPFVLRYFWEFNLNAANPAPQFDNAGNGNDGCFLTPGSPTGINVEATAPPLPQQFTDAWTHIHQQLVGTGAPLPQLSFSWNPNRTNDPDIITQAVDPGNYYPPDAGTTVDWIGVDGYQHAKNENGNYVPESLDDIFGSFYSAYSQKGKQMMIGETGSCDTYGSYTGQGQAAFLQSVATEFSNGTYPLFGAFNYFDAPGAYMWGPNRQNPCNWTLINNSPDAALSAFAALGANPYFSYFVSPQ